MNKPKEIVSADDDMVDEKLLQWADLDEVWDKYQLVEVTNFIRLAENAKNIEIDYKGWDAGMPGRSGTWHIIITKDEPALKGELRSIVAAFIWWIRQAHINLVSRQTGVRLVDEPASADLEARFFQHQVDGVVAGVVPFLRIA